MKTIFVANGSFSGVYCWLLLVWRGKEEQHEDKDEYQAQVVVGVLAVSLSEVADDSGQEHS